MQNSINILSMINEWSWFAFAAILAILEVVMSSSFFLLWLGISALTIGIIVLLVPALIWEYQLLAFAVVSIVCLGGWYVHLKNRVLTSAKPNLNRRNEQYVGRVVTLTTPIINGRGKIQIHDSIWSIEGPDLPAGTVVKIIEANGMVLSVIKV